MVNAKTRPHGDHFNTIRPGMHKYIEWLGGPERLAQLQVLMDNAEQQLPACPFCGAPTVLRGRWMYASSGVQAECSQCHCGTQPLFQEKTVLNRYYSLTFIESESGRLWQAVPFPVSWTVKMKKKQKETQDILSYHSQAAGCSDKARAKASGGRQPIEECGRTGL